LSQFNLTTIYYHCDKIDQLLAHGRWCFPGTLASSTTKTSCHDIAEILLKVVLTNQLNQIKCIRVISLWIFM
jgi:hypothetical protein